MPFIHINEYYINLDHISFIQETATEYVVHFGTPTGASHSTSVSKSGAAGHRLMQAMLGATKVYGD